MGVNLDYMAMKGYIKLHRAPELYVQQGVVKFRIIPSETLFVGDVSLYMGYGQFSLSPIGREQENKEKEKIEGKKNVCNN